MLPLYNTALLPLRAVVPLVAAWKGRDEPGAREWDERRTRVLPRVPPGGAWLHGSSVGEARIVRSVAARLRHRDPGRPLAVSAYTETGRALLPDPPAADAAFFMPLDFRGFPGRVLDAVRPRALVLVETELWPNLIHEAAARSIAVGVINGRLSSRRMARYRRLAALYGPLLRLLRSVGAQSADDADRFLQLGVSPSVLSLTGNVKYDLPSPAVRPEELRRRFGLEDGRPVLVAGSTAQGEDEPAVRALLQVRRSVPATWFVLAPRHPERAGDVARLAAGLGIRLHRLSAGNDSDAGGSDGLLVDTIGELSGLYTICRAAFVGGSLVPVGGHNVLEPVAAGVPASFGRHTHHFDEPARALVEAGAAVRVDNGEDLAEHWLALLGDDALHGRMVEAGRSVLESNRGALGKTVELVETLLAGAAP